MCCTQSRDDGGCTYLVLAELAAGVLRALAPRLEPLADAGAAVAAAALAAARVPRVVVDADVLAEEVEALLVVRLLTMLVRKIIGGTRPRNVKRSQRGILNESNPQLTQSITKT